MEILLPWDSMPIYKMWGRTGATYQAIRSGITEWTAPMFGARMEVVIRTDTRVGRAVGVIIMMYDGDTARPFAYGVFNDPDYQRQEEETAVSGSF
jgi:hypothetical protein